ELPGEPGGRVMSASDRPVAIGRYIRDDVCGRRPGNALGDELGRYTVERAESALLPGADEGLCRPRVAHRGPRRGEGKPPSGALRATLDGPRGGRATPGAQGRQQRPERIGTAGAKPSSGGAAGHASRGQQEVEEPRDSRYGGSRNVSVPTL